MGLLSLIQLSIGLMWKSKQIFTSVVFTVRLVRRLTRSTRSTRSTVDRRFGQAPPTQAKDLTFAIMDLEKKIKKVQTLKSKMWKVEKTTSNS